MKKVFIIVMSFLLGIAGSSQAQKFDPKENDQIVYQAEALIRNYEDLLNAITSAGLGGKEIQKIILASYSDDNDGRQFWDSNVIIEDDVIPEKAIADAAADLPVDKYLQNLDLVYTKSEEPSISLININASPVKQKDYYYVVVFFDSFFKNNHKKSKAPYKKVRRTAEVRVEKLDEKWNPYIVGIRYFDKQDSINETEFNVPLAERKIRPTGKQNEIDYTETIQEAEKAFANENYEVAQKGFEKALNIRPNSNHPLRRLNEIKNKDWYTFYYTKAAKAKQFRNYDEAVSYYKKAREVKIGDIGIRSDIDKTLEELSINIRNRDLFENNIKAGKYDDLIKDLNKRLKDKSLPKFLEAEMHYYLGKSYEAKNDTKDALKEYTEAIQHDGNYEQALVKRADMNTTLSHSAGKKDEKQKHLQEAHADLSLVITNNPEVTDFYIKRAEVRAYLDNHKEALVDYEKAIDVEPENANLFLKKAMYHLDKKVPEFEDGYAALNRAIELEPAFAEAYYRRGMVEYSYYKKITNAADDFKKAKSHNLNQIHKNSIDFLSKNAYQEGLTLYKTKNYANAAKKFEEASIISPDNSDAFFMKGEAQFEQKDFAGAVTSYTEALNINKELFLAFYKRGEAYYHSGEFQKALVEFEEVINKIKFEEAVKRAPFNASLLIDAYIGKGKSQQALGNYSEAIATNENTIKLVKKSGKKISNGTSSSTSTSTTTSSTPGTSAPPSINKAPYISVIQFDEKNKMAELYNNAGRCRYKIKNYKLATKNLDEAIDYQKRNSNAYYNRGVVYYNLRDYKNAINDFSSNLKYGNKSSIDYFIRAQTYQMANKHTEAIMDYREAIKLDSSLHDATYLSGKSLTKLNRHQEALVYFGNYENKVQPNKLNSNFYADRGIIRLKIKDYTGAKTDLEKALELDSGNAEAIYGLGCLYALENNIEKAIPEFERAFKSKSISRDRVREDTPVLLTSIANEKRFKSLLKGIDKKNVAVNTYGAFYEPDETARLIPPVSSSK
ncbi:hypothetical protein AAE02nite_18270 [Adhaeribacter aerolatus]|uniref:UDP-N-acetylglucosamine--peptide N-acetylglucosaminyltransferase SPINDLY n=1 Tax=Adhaeribacter aerolatus TaxID=670289 RepID=A0A512AWS0_9BACT|nr:tetratricopeptide repeat protein [Adhaeribacter aerolatus]GEO04163.1 hypothetical protein AAE02nite_18270 [Adhaeribacter aerolatus]